MEEKKTAIEAEKKQEDKEPANDSNTIKLNYDEKTQTPFDNIINYLLNGGTDDKELLKLYVALSDDEKKKFDSIDISEYVFSKMNETTNKIKEMIENSPVFDYPPNEMLYSMEKGLKEDTDKISAALLSYTNFLQSEEYKKNLSTLFNNLSDAIEPITKWNKEVKEVEPYLLKELEKEEYNGATPDNVLIYFNLTGKFWPDLFRESDKEEYRKAAKEMPADFIEENKITPQQALQAWNNAKKAKESSLQVNIKKADSIVFPLDKVNNNVWNLLEKDTKQGDITIDLSKGQDRSATAIYSINFDELEKEQGITISKELEPFDKRVYIASDSLQSAGNEVITISQIHYVLTGSSKPSKTQVERYLASVKKMYRAFICVDNEVEAKAQKGRVHYKYEGYLYPVEFVTASINGKITDTAIHFLKPTLPLVQFAKERKQVTTFTPKLLQNPYIKNTNSNIRLEDYLIDRISKEKHKAEKAKHSKIAEAFHCKIRYKTIFENTGINTTKQMQRAQDKIHDILLWFKSKECDHFISDYKKEKDGITVYWKQ